uniref:Vacuolar protein sorting-associated protein 51 homolog n=1 Tax=Heterorhabditis bacteriophora TaxID=37862 RepID=A0A1I7XKJ5_HETBA
MVGRRIMKRACDLKLEFAGFYSTLLLEQRDELDDNIKYLLKNVVSNIDFVDEVQRLCEDFGQRFVKLRTEGFRPDYFAILADATIKECTHLDSAMHKAHMTTQAFSQFGGMVFSSVRDGFYNEVRRLRRASNSFCTVSSGSSRRKKVSIESVDVPSVIGGSRSGSPGPSFSRSGSFRSVSPESYISDECFMPGDCENDGLLKPPNQNLLVTRSY